VWVLGGHHLQYGDEVMDQLKRGTKGFERTTLFSTRVYRLDF
jgi:hypothetical protein